MSDNISLEEFLKEIDDNAIEQSESYIYEKLRTKKKSEDKNEELRTSYEYIAFSFAEDYLDKPNGWGNYYGPMMVFKDENEKWMESPSIKLVDDKTIKYWSGRAISAKHPLMILRYADLVWEFSKKITNKTANINMAHLAIDNTIYIVESKLFKYEINAIIKLKRALSIGISINDNIRVPKLIQCIIKFEEEIAIDNKPNLWGFSFDSLVDKKNNLVDAKQEEKIINDLEAKILRLSQDNDNLDPLATEAAAMRLLRYYRSRNDKTNSERILKVYGLAYVWAAKKNKGMIAASWLQKVYELYMSNGLKEEAKVISQLLVEANKTINDEMKEISTEIKIDKKDFQEFIDWIISDNLKDALVKIAAQFLPDDKYLKMEILEMAKEAPLQALLSTSLMDRDGRTVARIGSVEEDIEGRVSH